MNVFKAEDIEGHKGEEDLDSVLQVSYRMKFILNLNLSKLQSMGEKVEEKKAKVKKSREKIEKTKGEKRERSRRSVEKELEGEEEEDKSEDNEKLVDDEIKVVDKVRNKFVEDDLMAFKDNFYLVTPGEFQQLCFY